MRKSPSRIALLLILIAASLFLTGCTTDKNTNNVPTSGPCSPGNVEISGYSDKGHRLSSCFVEYPGEPTRQDKSYNIVEDICGQFTQEFVSNLSGKKFIRIEPPTSSSLYNCEYVISDNGKVNGKEYILIIMEYLTIENQKIGQESMGRTMTADANIPMRNYVAYQEDGKINTIYLVLSDNKFISLDRSSTTAATNEEMLSFAKKLAEEIKGYK